MAYRYTNYIRFIVKNNATNDVNQIIFCKASRDEWNGGHH